MYASRLKLFKNLNFDGITCKISRGKILQNVLEVHQRAEQVHKVVGRLVEIEWQEGFVGNSLKWCSIKSSNAIYITFSGYFNSF